MITLNNIALPIPTGELYAYQEQFQELLDADAFASEPSPVRSMTNASIIPHGQGLCIPRVNYPDLPRGRLNSFIWPSGSTRWARGYFVATGDVKDKIVKEAGGDGPAKYLTLKIGEQNPITFEGCILLLPPRPLASQGTDDNDTDQVWVIPIVDFRFAFQYVNNDSGIARGDSWSTFMNNIGVFGPAPDSKYLKPDWNEFDRTYANSAVLMDACAHSVGQRVVWSYDGHFQCRSSDSSTDSLYSNLNIEAKLIAGNSFTDENSLQPAKVRVVFRMFDNGWPNCTGVYSYANGPPNKYPTLDGGELVIFSSAYADFGTGGGTPDNDSILSDLASQIAKDYYVWNTQNYDITFAGIVNWKPTGFDNWIEFRFGSMGPGGLQDFTRVVSMPSNVYADVQLSQDPSLHVIQTEGKLAQYRKSDNGGTDPWAISTTAKVFINEEGGFTIDCKNDFGDVKDLAPIWIQRQCDAWHVISTKC